jgi:hypothetical protein
VTGWTLRFLGLAAAVAGSAAAAQSTRTCEFAVAGWFTTQIELREARAAYRDCSQARTRACTAEQGRVQLLEQRLRLMRNYIDGYCRR